MNEGFSHLWTVLLWGLGACTTGFLFLAGWMWWIVGQLHMKASYEWIEEQFKQEIYAKMNRIDATLNEIKAALVGTYTEKGIITSLGEMERKVKEIDGRCKKIHTES